MYRQVYSKNAYTRAATVVILDEFPKVAIKIKPISTGSFREIDILRSIRPHVNVISLTSSSTLPSGHHYLTFPLYETDLFIYMLRRSTKVHNPTIVKQIFAGLAVIHDHDVIHGDLQPSNILLNTSTMTVALTDFGKSFLKHEDVSENLNITTYSAPEMLTKSLPYTEKIDIYAAGLITHELYNGKQIYGQNVRFLEQKQEIFYDDIPVIGEMNFDQFKTWYETIARQPEKRPSAKNIIF